MMFNFEARTKALLRGVWRLGSVSAAAANIGMDAANAGRHLRTAERRLGVRLLDRHRGGRGANAALTVAGRRYLDLAALRGVALGYDPDGGTTPIRVGGRTLFVAGLVAAGPVDVELKRESVALERGPIRPGASSVRNRFPVRVERIVQTRDGIYEVGLTSGSLRLESLVVRGALRDLRLRVGSRVFATIKAVSITTVARGE
ncbi:MAG TPA: TOBE domain-containing protein [Candidatus Thermoplasmatota archaeon]|nr:TOBE domain-containing protein [Candidatus Thermoplasmatota archaeon]